MVVISPGGSLGIASRFRRRADQLWLFVWLLLLLIGVRLAWLQLLHGGENRKLADSNRIQVHDQPPQRGRLLDRRGEVLATSRVSYQLVLYPHRLKPHSWPAVRNQLAKLLHRPPGQLEQQRLAAINNDPQRLPLLESLNEAEVLKLEENGEQFTGVAVEPVSERFYPHGRLGAHVLGYTGPISEAEMQRQRDRHYRLQDRVGRSGIEAALEPRLRGRWGEERQEVNAQGQASRDLADLPAASGSDVTLTIDLKVQAAAEAALDGVARGAVVAMDPRTGAILALASRPSFDPNLFSAGMSTDQWNSLNSPQAPLLNRALTAFPPASTFKVVTGLAAMQSGKFNSKQNLSTNSSFCLGGRCFKDHVGKGSLDFGRALAVSSNSFFYRLGLIVGPESIAETAQILGLGRSTGIELAAEESKGLVPGPGWKRRNYSQDWFDGDTVNTSVGQGSVLATPLQMARLYGAVGNGGQLVTPHLLQESPALQQRRDLSLKPEALSLLRRSLRQVVTNGTGTALGGLPAVAGKTGTAEDPPRADHTWFVGFSPMDHPKIVVATFAENSGGFGGTVAGPMARRVFAAYYAASNSEGTAVSLR
jgi:penicillin-binding protein 2